MRAPFAAVVLACLALAGGLAGCIHGAFFPAVIPDNALASGWSYDSQDSQGGTRGFAGIVSANYQVNRYNSGGGLVGAAFVVSVSSVPLYDVQGEIKKQIDQQTQQYGITLSNPRAFTGKVGADSTAYTVSDASAQGVSGLAIDAPYTCGANSEAVRIFGFVQTGGGLLGGNSLSGWHALAGSADQGSLGGMVAAVKCS